ncbi:MAG TPA: co-chaperone GroES [bacterium]|nr:co-chaperone GroES [bacterium]
MIDFQPLNNNILVKVESDEDKTSSGIYIPDSAKSEDNQGEVVAVPPGGGDEVAVGDTVMFKTNNTVEIKDGDDLYLVMPFKNILGKYVEVDKI